MSTPTSPHTGPEIAAALLAVHAESVEYWSTFSTAEFLAPIGDAWAPAENVRHLTKSIRAVSTGLRLPRWLLLLRFGRPARPSRDYAGLREVYHARLAQGADAGRFAPGPRPDSDDPEGERRRIMAYHREAIEGIVRDIARWPEAALDRRQLPHPALGTLTVREMLLFTLLHDRHHVDVVKRRRAAMAARG